MPGPGMKFSRRLKVRCKGNAHEYVTGIKPREAHTHGNAISVYDPDMERTVTFLSYGEFWWYLKLKHQGDVLEVREQYLLDPAITESISRELGTPIFRRLSTDMVITRKGGRIEAYAIKASEADIERTGERDKLAVQARYWELQGIPFFIRFKDQINPVEARNLESVFLFWDTSRIRDEKGILRHLIATGRIQVDMTKEPLDFEKLTQEFKKEIGEWTKLLPARS